MWGLLKALKIDFYKKESQQVTTIAPASRNPMSWQRRVRQIAWYPKRSQVRRFMEEVIHPAMNMVSEELEKQSARASVDNAHENRIRLEVDFGDDVNFVYEVRLRPYTRPAFTLIELEEEEREGDQKYYRAEVYLKEGGQDYDLMGWSQDQIIHDILDQYEKHIHFLHLVR